MARADDCSEYSASIDEPMFATASIVRAWLLVEVRGAWGSDAIHSSALGEHVPEHWKDDLKRRRIRAICVRSHLRDDEPGVRLFTCVARRPGAAPAALWQRDVGSLADVDAATADLAIDRSPGPEWQEVGHPIYLVCTNGRHDQCCANRGRPLIRALRASPWADRVWECSHVGGDRFAANLVVLPESVYFGRVAPDEATAIVESLERGRLSLDRFRGRTAYSLKEQAVEHFVRRETGIDTLDGVAIARADDDGTVPVRVGDRSLRVRVQRHLTTSAEPLTCKGPPGQLVPRFTLRSIE